MLYSSSFGFSRLWSLWLSISIRSYLLHPHRHFRPCHVISNRIHQPPLAFHVSSFLAVPSPASSPQYTGHLSSKQSQCCLSCCSTDILQVDDFGDFTSRESMCSVSVTVAASVKSKTHRSIQFGKGSFTIVNIFSIVQRVLILRPPSPYPN